MPQSQPFPDLPEVDPRNCATAPTFLRYEDVCQDGRVLLEGLPHSLGMVVWHRILGHHPITEMARKHGIIPILTRMVLSGDEPRIKVETPLEARGCFQLASATREGQIERLFLNAWVDLFGLAGGVGDPVRVGRVFAEHVFTRLFAPPGQRKVTALEHPGLPEVPAARYPWRDPADLLELPDGARWIDDRPVTTSTIAFALNHTDSNQHVNSLAYLRLFEHEVVQRMAVLGRSTVRLARHAEVSYRKPCFAGDRQTIAVRCFERDDRIGAIGGFVDPSEVDSLTTATPRGRCFVRIWFAA